MNKINYLKHLDKMIMIGKQVLGKYKRYFRIDQQISRHFMHYGECPYHPPYLLSNSNNKPVSYCKRI